MGDSAAVIKWHENIVDFGLFYIALELEVFSVSTLNTSFTYYYFPRQYAENSSIENGF